MAEDMIKCSVAGCKESASYEVILYDYYKLNGDVFFERDFTCPFMCEGHVRENEEKAMTFPPETSPHPGEIREIIEMADPSRMVPAGPLREYRGSITYPYSNQNDAQGFTIYRPLEG